MQYEIYCSYFVQKVKGTENKTVPSTKNGDMPPVCPGICAHDKLHKNYNNTISTEVNTNYQLVNIALGVVGFRT